MRFSLLNLLNIAALFFLATPVYAGGLNVPQNIRLDQVECGSNNKYNAYAYFSWDSAQGATSYRFYSKVADGNDNYRAYDEINTPKYKMSFNPQFDFYVAVSSVNTFTGNPPSVTESDKSKDFYLSAKKLLSLCDNTKTPSSGTSVNTAPIQTPQQNMPQPTVTTNTQKEHNQDLAVSQAKINELEKKLNIVENKLAETQKKQSLLEEMISRLINMINHLFKF